MTNFEYAIKVLGAEIERLRHLNGYNKPEIQELKKTIKILTDGQAYLRKEPPIGIRFFKDL